MSVGVFQPVNQLIRPTICAAHERQLLGRHERRRDAHAQMRSVRVNMGSLCTRPVTRARTNEARMNSLIP